MRAGCAWRGGAGRGAAGCARAGAARRGGPADGRAMDFNMKKLASDAGIFFTRAVQVRSGATLLAGPGCGARPEHPAAGTPSLRRCALGTDRWGP